MSIFGKIGASFAHNALSTVAGLALPALANGLQSAVTHSPYLATHPSAQAVVAIVFGLVVRDGLKQTVPAFALSSGATEPGPTPNA